MISFGTSSDRIGTPPPNKAYFVTFAKSIPNRPLAPYVSINYSETDQRLNFPFGMNIGLNPQWDLLPMNDGRHSHLLLTWKGKDMSASLIWAWFKRPGVSVSWKF